jgi:hypothetical protein
MVRRRIMIEIDDLKIHENCGQPSTFQGKHSGRDLAQIDLRVRAAGEQKDAIDALFEKKVVTIADPFAQRLYEGTFQMETSTSSSEYVGTT